MKRLLSFLISFLMLSFFAVTAYATSSRPVNGRVYVNAGEIVDGDCFINNRQTGEKLCDSNERTYLFFRVTQSSWFDFPWGGTIWSAGTQESFVEQKIRERNPGRTRDTTCTVWPRGSSPSQPETDWAPNQWRQLQPNQFLVVPSGTTYYNFTSQGQNTNSLNIIKPTTIVTTQATWIWTTTLSKIHTADPGFEKITLTPSTNTQPQDEEWLYSNIPAHGYATGWMEVFINNSWVDMKQSCLNGLVVENNSNNQVRIRYKQADPSNPQDRKLVTIYSSGNSLEGIKTVYANTIGVPVSQLSVRKLFLNPTSTNPFIPSPLPN